MPDIRAPGEEHREQIARLLARSLNAPLERVLLRSPNLALEDFRCAFEGERVVACAAEYHFLQWFGGRAIPCSGIFAVATLPERREVGLASAAVGQILSEARRRGDPLTALYPAVLPPYRRLGYEIAGTFNEHRLPLDALPSMGPGLPTVEPVEIDRDLEGVKVCYRASVRHDNGPIEPTRDEWWTKRIFDGSGEESFAAVVVRNGGTVEAFAAFRREPDPGTLGMEFGLKCSSLAAATEPAMRALLGYFRGFRGMGHWVDWSGPPQEPVALLVPDRQLIRGFTFPWMLRVLDVPGALKARGWPAIDAEAVIAVEDPMFPENAGPWKLSVRGGEASVEPAAGEAPRPIPIGALSSMFSGYLRVSDAVRLGLLAAEDPAVPALGQLLAGPDPWSPIFF